MSKLSIIIPVYFNDRTLLNCYHELCEQVLPQLDDYEIIFVDDGSGDASWSVLQQIKESETIENNK